MRKTLAITATSLALLAGSILPAGAADGTTLVTLSTVSTLTIVPTPTAALVGNGTTATGTLGLTTVLDPTGAGYTVSLSAPTAGAFTMISDSTKKIAGTSISACVSNGPTDVLGSGAFSAVVGCGAAVALADDAGTAKTTLFTAAANTGVPGEATFLPQITVDVSGAAAGIFTGTITQTAI